MQDSAIRLVIFDCDGVLVDSEAIACRVDAALLSALGFDIGFEELRDRYVGVSTATMCADIEARFGRRLPPDIAGRLLEAVLAAFERELAPIPGIPEALRAIDAPRCVASSSDPPRIRRSLEIAGLLHLFEPHLFSATMVARGKPAPDIFLHAAAAGRAAGMTVWGFAGGPHCGSDHARDLAGAGAAHVFMDMVALQDAFLRRG